MNQPSRLTQLHDLLRSGDVITTDGYRSALDADDTFVYWKRDFLFRGGEWRGAHVEPLVRNPRRIRGRRVIVGHSDLSTGRAVIRTLRALGARGVAGTNVKGDRRFAESLPLGLTNDCDDTPMHRVLGDVSHLVTALESADADEEFRGRIFACFTESTAPQHRAELARMARSSPGIDWAEPDMSPSGRVAFLRRVRTSDFVLCPRGNGRDTHRLWEALYLDSFPVVLRGQTEPSFLERFPILEVDRWQQIDDLPFLEASWHRLRQEPWEVRHLTLTWWIDHLHQWSRQVPA